MEQKFAEVTCFVTKFSTLGAKDADASVRQLASNCQVQSPPKSMTCQGAVTNGGSRVGLPKSFRVNEQYFQLGEDSSQSPSPKLTSIRCIISEPERLLKCLWFPDLLSLSENWKAECCG